MDRSSAEIAFVDLAEAVDEPVKDAGSEISFPVAQSLSLIVLATHVQVQVIA